MAFISTESAEMKLDQCLVQCAQENVNLEDDKRIKLFSVLALLNSYIPDSYLLISECQKILGPPDPIFGGPPLEERMRPFTVFIKRSSAGPQHVCMVDPSTAKKALEVLVKSGISRSATMKNLMVSLCGNEIQPHIMQFIKDLLTKRKVGKKGKDDFSQLIEDIQKKENFHSTVNVLKTASDKFINNPNFPQTIARLYYKRGGIEVYEKAEEWAMTAIQRAPRNSHVADTLGQIYKNRLLKTNNQEDVLRNAKKALRAFEDVERKAEEEVGPEMTDDTGTESVTDTFNNRGRFGFIQVAKIAFEKLTDGSSPTITEETRSKFFEQLKMKVEDTFDFFEWYLTYSKMHITDTEPSYFWKDIADCYKNYTTNTASESTSFPGLLNHGLFTSKGRFANLKEAEETVADLEELQGLLKATYEADVNNVKAAETYILSNIILSNKMHNSSKLTPVTELQTIIHRFLDKEVRMRSPEFYLLVLLLFWPEQQPQVVQEEDDEQLEDQATEDDGSEVSTWEDQAGDEDHKTRDDTAQIPPDLMFDLDLQKYATFMKDAFERERYAMYLRGRYLLPLFYLGKGSGLSKWIHKSRLDAIVENMVDAELPGDLAERTEEKWMRINTLWSSGEVWQIQEIKNMLLPVDVCRCPTTTNKHQEQEMFVCIGGKKILSAAEVESNGLMPSKMLFYVGFTIQGPVFFHV